MSIHESLEDTRVPSPPEGWTSWQDFFHQRHKAARERIVTVCAPLAPKALPKPMSVPLPSPPRPIRVLPPIAASDFAAAHQLLEAMVDPFERAADQARRINTVRTIQRIACRRFDVSMNDMLSARRTASVVFPRQIAMYLVKVLTLKSLPEIGRRFGGRDHTTVLHAVRRIAKDIAADFDLAGTIELLRIEYEETCAALPQPAPGAET